MFQILDDNGDGFITINEINENLDQIIKIPQDVKEVKKNIKKKKYVNS